MSIGARLLTPLHGEPFRFDAGSFALELLVTGAPGRYAVYEIFDKPENLGPWIAESRMTIGIPLDPENVVATDDEMAALRRFRDTLWRVAPMLAREEHPTPEDLAVINESVGEPPRIAVDAVTGRTAWAPPVTGTQILAAAARDAVGIIGTDLRERVRQCQGSKCNLMFLDTSRPGNRRWCSMQRCGNRHKVGAYRERRG